jgi:hypothetical protein
VGLPSDSSEEENSNDCKPHPHDNPNDWKNYCRVFREEMFFIEYEHSSVLMPLHKERLATPARTFEMHSTGIWVEQDFPSLFAEPQAQVKILAVQKKILIHQTHILQRGAAQKHAGSGDSLYFNRFGGQRLRIQIEILQKLRKKRAQELKSDPAG